MRLKVNPDLGAININSNRSTSLMFEVFSAFGTVGLSAGIATLVWQQNLLLY